MSLTIKADNRQLIKGQKYSFLSNNYSSGVSTIVVDNGTGFTTDDYLLFGNFGSETAELVSLSSILVNTMTLKAKTLFAHPESTKITIIPYNQVKFYHTVLATFNASEDLLTTIDIQADSLFTKYTDSANTTGFDWFCFYNSSTAVTTTPSNAVPLASFDDSSVKKVLDDFFSLLNDKELKIVSLDDAFSWLNEAYGIARTELNMVNNEFTVSATYPISVIGGTAEYLLPDNFASLDSSYNTDKYINKNKSMEKLAVSGVDAYNDNYLHANIEKYYIRGKYIGFAPTPTSSYTIYIRYKTNSTRLTSYYDEIDLPGISPGILKDFMMFRACKKLSRVDAKDFFDIFNSGINRMKISNINREGGLDSFTMDPTTNV